MAGDLDIVGSAGVDVVPVTPNFHERLKAAVLPAADRVGEDVGRKLGEAIGRHIVISIPDAVNQGGRAARVAATRQGADTGGAFARSLRAKLEEAFRAMPKLDVRIGDTGVDAELARIRAKLEQLSNKRIGIDIDAETARAKVADLEEQLRRLGAAHPNVAVRADTAAARAALAEFRAQIDAATADPARIRVETDGSFGAKLRAAVREAEASLPNINIDANTTPAQLEIARIREELTSLRDARVGIDIDSAAATAKIDALKARLATLSASDADIAIRVDAGAAEAQLAVVHHMVNDLDRDDVHIRVVADTAAAKAALVQLAWSLGLVAAIPLVPIAAAGIGAIASAAVAAGAGVGALALVAVPAIKGVTAAIQAKTAADKQAAQATNNGAAATVRAAQNAIQMANAQQALTAAHRNAARSIAQANEQVAQAERNVAQATQRASDERRQAAENVQRAEQSLAQAQRQEQQAQADLTQARKDAADQLAALDDKLKDGALSQRDAALSVQEAADNLARVKAANEAGTASDTELARAQLSYDQAVQAQKEQSKNYRQLQEDARRAKKEGVDGNDAVKQAAQKLADAQQNVKDQVQALADAHRQAARTEVQAAQEVADAQRSLADAVQNAADTQVQAQDSIASAERGVESARLSSIDTTTKATSKADAYRQALAKLSPEQRKLYDAIAGPKGLTAAFKDWSRSLEPDVLPIFTQGVNGAKDALPALTPLVKNAADAVKDLMDRASAQLKTPFWKGFKKDIDESAKPAIVGLGVAFGNIFKGMAGVIDAFLPHMDGISSTMQRITGRFADWGTKLKGSPEFEGFLDYVKDRGPGVADTLGKVGGGFLSVAKALEPFSSVILELLGNVAATIKWVADNAPWAIQLIYGLWIATRLWNLAMALSPVGRIILLLIGLGLALKYAWDHSETFRDIVTGAWNGIRDAAVGAWQNFLKPTFDAIRDGLKFIGDKATWLWQSIFVPAWNIIVEVMKYAIAIILTVLITPLVLAIEGVGLLIGWLWTDCFKPTWDAISGAAVWLWQNVLGPFFGWIWHGIKWVGDKFVWLYDHAVAPTAGWIADKAKWLWDKALDPAFHGIWGGLKWVGDKFKWLYDHSVGPVAGWISDKANWLYDKGLKPAFDRIKSAVKLVGDAFGDAKDAIKEAWKHVVDITKTPVNFVIDKVYTHGIKAVWDKVAGFVGLDKLPDGPKLLAEGGRTYGGIPGKDSIPALLMADEFVIKRDSARKIGFGNLEHMNRTGEVPRFAGGGIVGALGSAWDWTKDTVGGAISKGIDWAKTGADLIAHPSKIWNKLVKPFLDNAAKRLGVAHMGEALLKFPLKMVSGLKDKIVDAVTGGGGGGGNIGGTIPSGKRRSIITQALAAAHVPPPGTLAQWLAGMNTLITRESGWNPNAINNWDSNAKAGHPSQGLTQTIPGTFNHYVPASLRSRGILDPVANVAASVRYIVSRYGNITNVQQANANLPPKGYALGGRVEPTWFDNGGLLPKGLSLVANGTGSPEPVFTRSQFDDIRAAKTAVPTELHADVHVFVGDREITDIVRTEVQLHDASTASAINTGRWV
jgi:hypothetical protein